MIIFLFYFYSVEWLIVDEADKLFEEGIRGFREQLDEITRACVNTNLRRGMFSATNTPAVSKWCRRNMKSLITVTVGQRYVCIYISINFKNVKTINDYIFFLLQKCSCKFDRSKDSLCWQRKR